MTKDPQLTDCVDFELFAVQVAGITHLAALPYTSAGEAEVEKRVGGVVFTLCAVRYLRRCSKDRTTAAIMLVGYGHE